ncbi:MAG TPA: hypothetical protein VIG72_10250, partial [Pontibacter sp.]
KMAEINIERKKKPVWPWVLLLLVIVALIAWALYQNSNNESETTAREAPATGAIPPAPAQQPVYAKYLI